jgi:energy-coupling factor transport system permease protein
MQDFAYLRHITLGQYLPRDSVVHALDPRVKLLFTATLAIAISVNASYTANAALLAALFALALLSLVDPLYILSSLKPAVPLIIMFAAVQALFFDGPYGPTTVPRLLWAWGPFEVSTAGVRLVVISILRLLELWLLTSLLTNTTPTSTLARGIESLLRPLSAAGFPGHELALVFTLALRFLPVFALELEDALKAQVSRGAEWHSGRLSFIRNSRRVAGPLFADALRRAEELATAMEARCYVGGRGRTHMLALRFARADWLALVTGMSFAVLMLVCRNTFRW